MPNKQTFVEHIRELIAKDDTATAIKELSALLKNSPKLDEAIVQSSRYTSVTNQIRLGLINSEDANVTKNQISLGVLNLLRDIEDQQLKEPDIKAEVERFAINIQNSKNVLVNSSINAGGNVTVGDTTVNTESETSRRVRLFLFVFVPLLAMLLAWFYIRNKNLSEPLNLTVVLDDKTPNANIPMSDAEISLTYGDKTETQTVNNEATFKGIPANFKNSTVKITAKTQYYFSVEKSFVLTDNKISLPIQRDNSLSTIFGNVKDENGNALKDVQITVQDISVQTEASGNYKLQIPFEKQLKTQRLKVFKQGYKIWEHESPVVNGVAEDIILKK